MSNQKDSLSRPVTPDLSREVLSTLGVRSQQPAQSLKPIVTGAKKPVVIQTKEGPEILTSLKTLINSVQLLDSKVSNLETLVKNIRSSTSCEFEAPEFLPLKTHEDIMKYDSASDEERQKMAKIINWHQKSHGP